MDHIIPISEARKNLTKIVNKISSIRKPLIITRNGRAKAVIISPEELETLEIKADQNLLQSIQRAQEDIKENRLYSHEEVFKNV